MSETPRIDLTRRTQLPSQETPRPNKLLIPAAVGTICLAIGGVMGIATGGVAGFKIGRQLEPSLSAHDMAWLTAGKGAEACREMARTDHGAGLSCLVDTVKLVRYFVLSDMATICAQHADHLTLEEQNDCEGIEQSSLEAEQELQSALID